MFGLGWMELLIIGGAIMLLVGPVALKRLMGSARALDDARRDLMSPGGVDRLLGEGDEREDARDQPRDEEDAR